MKPVWDEATTTAQRRSAITYCGDIVTKQVAIHLRRGEQFPKAGLVWTIGLTTNALAGKPVIRMTAFQVPEGVLTMVGIGVQYRSFVRHCTEPLKAIVFKSQKRLETRMNKW